MSSFLPPEIVTNILSRLPVKSLLRFRCVSKPWCSLIDSPDFANMHLNQSMESKSNRNLILGFINFSVHSIELRSLDSPGVDSIDSSQCLEPPVSGTYVSGSCNGLTHMFKKISEYTHNYIWNPFTRKYRELPAISFDFLGLPAYIDLRMIEKHGFAYVSETDEYKVVQVTEIRGFDFSYIGNQAYIFSSRSNEWERLEPFPYQILPTRALDAHLNGALHTVVETDFSQWELMVFDTKTKQHSILPKPDFASVIVDVRVQVLEGNLCLLHTRVINSVDVRMDIWVMKDYGVEASWFKLLSVAVDPGSDLSTQPLIMTDNGAEVLLTDNVKKLIWYNLSGASVRVVTVNVLPLEFFAEVWSESLVSFPGFINVDDEKAKSRGNDGKGKKQDDVNKQSQQKKLKDKGNTSSTKGFLSQGFKLKL